jgi:hypothetical protein
MPNDKTMPDEESSLVGRGGPAKKAPLSIHLNIETLRFVGLIAGTVLLLTGKFVSFFFVKFPAGNDHFDVNQTFIFKLFHFNHTCTVLDLNPAKTVSALVIMLHTVPMNIFVVLSYLRIKNDYNNKKVPYGLLLYSKITTPFIFIAFMYFYMVFVNSPMGDPSKPEDMMSFILHYIPYLLWQTAMVLMAIQQCLYIAFREITPFGIPVGALKGYCVFTVALGIYYTVFIVSFIMGSPVLDTENDAKRLFAQVVMYGFDIVVVFIPMAFAYLEMKNGNVSVLEFHD